MRLTDRNGFANRLIAMVLTATAIALLTMDTGFLTLDIISSRASERDHLALLADILAQNSSASLDFDDSVSANQVMGALKSEQRVVQGCLYDEFGHLFAHYERDQDGPACALSASQLPGTVRGYFAVTRSVELNGASTGTLFVNSVPRDLLYRWKRLATLAGILLLLSFVLGSVAGLILQRKITAPISALSGAMQLVTTQQNFAASVKEVGPTEIKLLCAGFNAMLVEIDQSHAQLQNAKESAEDAHRRLVAKSLTLESERGMLRGLIDNIPDVVYLKDTRSRWTVANSRLARLVGVNTPQELVGKTDSDYLPPETVNAFYMDDQNVMDSGQPLHNREEMVVDETGHELHLLTTKVPLRDNNGKIIGIAGISRDITIRKKMENALRDAERKYRSIFDNAIVGIFQSTLEGRFLSVNPAMASAFGFDSPEEMCASITDVAQQLYADPKRREPFLLLLRTVGNVQNFECQALRKDGSSFWVSMSVQAIRHNGTIHFLEGMCTDITERYVLREQLLQAQKLESVGQLAAGIAHEINTPTQYIWDNVRFLKDAFQGLASLLSEYERLLSAARDGTCNSDLTQGVAAVERADTGFLLEEIPNAIDQALEGVTRVSSIVSAMKEFSHPDTKEKTSVDLNHAINSTITVARNEWKYVANLVTDFDQSLPPINCLPGEFNQVILNLIINAAHAVGDVVQKGGAEKGTITVRTRNCPEFAEIRIEDTGTGIPESIRNRVFDPFFTTKEIGKGTGQGLAIARSVVVVKHGGTIHLESEMGKGTTFVIRLPIDGNILAAGTVAA